MQAINRKELIEQIYAKCPERWPDLRHYARPNQLFERMLLLRDRIRAYPMKKVACHNARYRRMVNEYRMLKAQLSLLSVDGPEDSDLYTARALIDRTMSTAGSEDQRFKRAHTLILMHFIMAKYSEEQLTMMLTSG